MTFYFSCLFGPYWSTSVHFDLFHVCTLQWWLKIAAEREKIKSSWLSAHFASHTHTCDRSAEGSHQLFYFNVSCASPLGRENTWSSGSDCTLTSSSFIVVIIIIVIMITPYRHHRCPPSLSSSSSSFIVYLVLGISFLKFSEMQVVYKQK